MKFKKKNGSCDSPVLIKLASPSRLKDLTLKQLSDRVLGARKHVCQMVAVVVWSMRIGFESDELPELFEGNTESDEQVLEASLCFASRKCTEPIGIQGLAWYLHHKHPEIRKRRDIVNWAEHKLMHFYCRRLTQFGILEYDFEDGTYTPTEFGFNVYELKCMIEEFAEKK
jgi:hypothetical protein